MQDLFAATVPALINLAALVATTLVGWLATRAARWIGLQNEEALRRPLVDLVNTMADAVRLRLGGTAMTAAFADRAVVGLADHVERSYPDRIRALGVERPALENMIRVRLGLPPEPLP